MQVRHTPITVSIDAGELTVEVSGDGYTRPITVAVAGVVRELRSGDSARFALTTRAGQCTTAACSSASDASIPSASTPRSGIDSRSALTPTETMPL